MLFQLLPAVKNHLGTFLQTVAVPHKMCVNVPLDKSCQTSKDTYVQRKAKKF